MTTPGPSMHDPFESLSCHNLKTEDFLRNITYNATADDDESDEPPQNDPQYPFWVKVVKQLFCS